mmetsp:Transcript_7678/g.27372  ORF Transcript_7678/g.27372 Transcript_7678/m.27372 type:complete len:99 (-) Transcript_7678:84-380(-)
MNFKASLDSVLELVPAKDARLEVPRNARAGDGAGKAGGVGNPNGGSGGLNGLFEDVLSLSTLSLCFPTLFDDSAFALNVSNASRRSINLSASKTVPLP